MKLKSFVLTATPGVSTPLTDMGHGPAAHHDSALCVGVTSTVSVPSRRSIAAHAA